MIEIKEEEDKIYNGNHNELWWVWYGAVLQSFIQMMERRDKIPFSKDSALARGYNPLRSKRLMESDDVRGSCISVIFPRISRIRYSNRFYSLKKGTTYK